MSDSQITKFSGTMMEGPFLVRVGSYDYEAVPQLRELTVPDLESAARAVVAYIGEEDLGSRDWCGGEVLRDDGSREVVAVVSYNGRVWAPGGTNPEGQRIPDMTREFVL